MDRLPHDPRNFREMVEADLRRGARLIIKVQDEIDPQFRVATPKGDWAIAVTLPNDEQGRDLAGAVDIHDLEAGVGVHADDGAVRSR